MISHGKPQKIELMVVGRVSPDLMRQYEQRLAGDNGAGEISINWAGLVPAERIPEIDRAAHLLYSSDINPACPNSVIEALACGLPVVSFDTGALPELVTPGAGRVVAYGGDPWHLDPPDVNSLAHAATQVLNDQASFREGARARAEAAFGLDAMLDAYLQVLGGG
jgi:glycosyltransferase involved in cell wall biosynthesis